MAKEWAGDLVHAWASRLAYGILLSLTILIIAWMLASTLSFGLRLLWLGVILFFFWKLVQKVQELIRPGAASIAPNLAGDVQRRTAGGAKTLTRATTRTTVGAGAGVLAAGQRRRMIAADPTRGPLRRSAGTLLTPVSLVTGGLRGAAFGPQDAQRRAWKTMNRGQVNAVKAASAAQAAAGGKKENPGKAGTSGTTVTPSGRTAHSPVPGTGPASPPHRTAPATTGQPPPAQTYDTVAIPRRVPVQRTDRIPRPAVPASEPTTDWWPAVVGHPQTPAGSGDEEPVRRPLDSAPAGKA
jgi:hypothetical protein